MQGRANQQERGRDWFTRLAYRARRSNTEALTDSCRVMMDSDTAEGLTSADVAGIG